MIPQELTFTGPNAEGSIDISLHATTVLADIYSVPVDDCGARTVARVEASADQAEAIGLAWLEWSARARARERANAPLPLFGVMG